MITIPIAELDGEVRSLGALANRAGHGLLAKDTPFDSSGVDAEIVRDLFHQENSGAHPPARKPKAHERASTGREHDSGSAAALRAFARALAQSWRIADDVHDWPPPQSRRRQSRRVS